MDSEFIIPLNLDDLLHNESPLYVVREVASPRELKTKIEESRRSISEDGCSFILYHFDTLFSVLVQAKDVDVRDVASVLNQSITGIQQMVNTFPNLIDDDMHPDQRKKLLNIAKMIVFTFGHSFKIVEDKRLGKDMLFDIKGRKKTAKSIEQDTWDEDRNQSLFALYGFVQLPLHKLWSPPVVEEDFVSLISNACYKILEDPGISAAKMKPMRESIYQILGTLVSRFQHGLSCTVKIVQLLKIYEHLCTPLAECVIALVQDYGCRGFLKEIVREISESDSLYESNGSKAFSVFLTEISKNASDLVLPIMSHLLPHLDNDPYTMRNCVLEIIGEVVVQILSSETSDETLRDTRNTFLDHLQEHLLDTNAYVRSKALKVWHHLAQERSIPLSRFGDLLSDVVERLGDVSWTVVKSAVQLVKAILESNPFGAKMNVATLKEKLVLEEKTLVKLQEESCNLENMTRAQRWEVLVPSITLALENVLKSDVTDNTEDQNEAMSEAEMLSTLKDVRSCIDKKEFEQAARLVQKAEKLLSGACDLRKDKRLEWQVDYFVRMIKKIYVEMGDEDDCDDNDDEDKENVESTQADNKKKPKKGKKRRLQDLHPEEDEKVGESETVKAASTQARVVQYLKDCIVFAEEMEKAINMISSLLHCGQVQVIQDTIEFLTTAFQFGFDQAESGIQQMLLLVWSSESSMKEAVAAAYKSLYLETQPGLPMGRAQAVEIVRNLCKLLKSLGQNERAALEILVMEWVSSGAIDKSCIQVMWERFSRTLKDTTEDESQGALQLLTMVAASTIQTVKTNIDVLIKVGFGVKGERQSALIADTCAALLKLAPTGRVTTDDEALRYPRDHLMFQTLGDILREGFTIIEDSNYLSMATAAVDVIYQLSENPDITCAELLTDICDQMEQFLRKDSEPNVLSCPSAIVTRLLFFIGHIAHQQWIHLDKYTFRELKRRNRLREKFAEETKDLKTKAAVSKEKKKKKGGKSKDNPNESALQTSILSASHILMEKQEADDDGLGADIAADDAEAEYINNICESEVLFGNTVLSKLSPLVVAVCANPQKYNDPQLQATASLSLTKLMLVSSDFCERHLQLVFTMMEKSSVPEIRSKLVYAMGDLANRFPNLIEPWTKHFYSRLGDNSSTVRQDTIMVLKHLITNEMVKVRGQISDLALCIVDPDPRISSMASMLFEELSKKGNTLYNVMPDIISRLSNPSSEVEEEKFQAIMKFLMQLIQKDRQMESLIDKLCQRFRASSHERQWSDLAYCLGLMQYSDRSLRRLLENLPCYAEKLTVPSIYEIFCNILYEAGKTQKPERLLIVEELTSKIEECLQKGLPNGGSNRIDSGTAESQDSDDEKKKPKLSARTPGRRPKIEPRTPGGRGRGRGRGSGRGQGRRRTTRSASTSEEESSSSSSDDDNVFVKKSTAGRGRRR